MHDWRTDNYVMNTIQHMLTNAKMDDITIYADGDNPVYKIKKKYLYQNGTVKVPKKQQLMIWHDLDQSIEAVGVQNVYNWLAGNMIFDTINSTNEQRKQVLDYFRGLGIDTTAEEIWEEEAHV